MKKKNSFIRTSHTRLIGAAVTLLICGGSLMTTTTVEAARVIIKTRPVGPKLVVKTRPAAPKLVVVGRPKTVVYRPGLVVEALPRNTVTIRAGGKIYYRSPRHIYFRLTAKGYVVVLPPRGRLVVLG